jgi:hypothetical protein
MFAWSPLSKAYDAVKQAAARSTHTTFEEDGSKKVELNKGAKERGVGFGLEAARWQFEASSVKCHAPDDDDTRSTGSVARETRASNEAAENASQFSEWLDEHLTTWKAQHKLVQLDFGHQWNAARADLKQFYRYIRQQADTLIIVCNETSHPSHLPHCSIDNVEEVREGDQAESVKVRVHGISPECIGLLVRYRTAPVFNDLLNTIEVTCGLSPLGRNPGTILRNPDLAYGSDHHLVVHTAVGITYVQKAVVDALERGGLPEGSKLEHDPNTNEILLQMGSAVGRISMEPWMSPAYMEALCFTIRVLDPQSGSKWANNGALTHFLQIWHKAGVSKWKAEQMLRAELRSQGLPVNRVLVVSTVKVTVAMTNQQNASVLVARQAAAHWWNAEAVQVVMEEATDISRADSDRFQIWAGAPPSREKTNPTSSYCLQIRLEARSAASHADAIRRDNESARNENQSLLVEGPAIKIDFSNLTRPTGFDSIAIS